MAEVLRRLKIGLSYFFYYWFKVGDIVLSRVSGYVSKRSVALKDIIDKELEHVMIMFDKCGSSSENILLDDIDYIRSILVDSTIEELLTVIGSFTDGCKAVLYVKPKNDEYIYKLIIEDGKVMEVSYG